MQQNLLTEEKCWGNFARDATLAVAGTSLAALSFGPAREAGVTELNNAVQAAFGLSSNAVGTYDSCNFG